MEEQNTSSLSVYITGITEGLGHSLAQALLARGHKVSGSASTLEEANAIRALGAFPVYNGLLRAGEIASTLRLVKADVLVNTATQAVNALPVHNPDWDDAIRLLREGTAACVAASEQAGIKQVIHLSYAFVYGDTHGHAADESAHVSAGNALTQAALDAEKMVLASSVPGVVLRAGFNYGGDTASLRALQRALIDKGSLSLGETAVSWVHVDDLCSAIIAVIEKQVGGETFNIADPVPASPRDFVVHFAEGMGVMAPGRSNIPQAIVNLMTDATSRSLLDAAFQVSSAKAQDELGWQPAYTSLDAGIEQALLSIRAAQTG